MNYDGCVNLPKTLERPKRKFSVAFAAGLLAFSATGAAALDGAVMTGDTPIVGSEVVLWQAGQDAPVQLATATTAADGSFKLDANPVGDAGVLYLTAQGGTPSGGVENPAIALMTLLGSDLPEEATLNEMTTVSAAYVSGRFLDGTALSGNALGLTILSKNHANLVDVATGGFGERIQDPLNSTQTSTMANLATLSTLLAGCVRQVQDDSCDDLFSATTAPNGTVPSTTLDAVRLLVKSKSHQPEAVFALLDAFYPVPKGKTLRNTPYMPYRSTAPTAWTLAIKFTGGGLSAPGKMMFDKDGNLWAGANFIVGSQASDALWDGNLAKFTSDGVPLSPITTGFHGGGLEGPAFSLAIDQQGRAWITSTGSNTVSVFDSDGTPLSPEEGYNFDGALGQMGGIIATPKGDIWGLDFSKGRVVSFESADPAKGKLYCQGDDPTSDDSTCGLDGAFFLAIDQQDRIWITNAIKNYVSRFSVKNPEKMEHFKVGYSPKGLAVDSKGNVWVANTLGERGFNVPTLAHLAELKLTGRLTSAALHKIGANYLIEHRPGSVSMLLPDGSMAPGSNFKADGSLVAPWGVAIDGDDHVWVANFVGKSIVQLCGSRVETCPEGLTTGDAISPIGGFVGGGMQFLTDVQIDPAGNVWVANNWQDPRVCVGDVELSTRCGGQGITVFYGMAAPVEAPLIGPAVPAK